MEKLKNYINGAWVHSHAETTIPVINPATKEELGQVPLGAGNANDVEDAVRAAKAAFPGWSQMPVNARVQPLFHLKRLLEEHQDELARIITQECGKTLPESVGELTRAIENVEVACGMPMHIQSEFSENIANGIDEFMIRQPLGVSACISPFNFPGMIPFWFLPYAIACGNTFVLKPSEKVPATMIRVFELMEQLDLPPGVLNLVHGGKDTVDAILEHPDVKSVSFVGSTNVAKYIYSKGTANGKRVQAQGGAKNPLVVLPDADIEMTTRIIGDSVFGCAGQRCLAASNIILAGDERGAFRESLIEAAKSRKTGYGLEEGVEMGPLITPESKERVETLIQQGIEEGATAVVDGRGADIPDYGQGNFLRPTILENVALDGDVVNTEIFGPVMSLLHMSDLDTAIDFINKGAYGNMACIFTASGAAARKFRSTVMAGNIGVNIGVAAPMAQFPFSGWKESFFGDLHGQSRHAVEFFTQTKVVVERWPKVWSRQF